MKNRAIIIGIILFSLLSVPAERAMATDYTLLEMLIKSHKDQSNKLKARAGNDFTKAGVSELEKDKTGKYTDIVKKASKRMGDLYSYTTFAADMVHITLLAKEVAEMEAKAIELSLKCKLDYPIVTRKAVELHTEFGRMTKRIADLTIFVVSSGLGVTMATMKQRKDFTGFISSELNIMRRKISNFNFYAKALMRVGKPGLASWIKQAKGLYEYVDDTAIVSGIKKDIDNLSRK